jgi:hypothetical protein
VGFVEVFLNGSKLSAADFTATNGSSIVLASGAAVGDTLDVVAYATQTVANVYTQSQSDARYLQLTGGTLTGDLTGTTSTFSGDVTIADKIVHSGDTNTALRFPAVDTFTVETNGSEAFRIDSGGHALFTLATNAVGNFADNVGEVGSGNFCLQVSNTAQDALKPLGFRAEDIRFATGSAERFRTTDDGILVGKTSSNSNTVGIELSSSNLLRVARSGGATAYLNRKTNDGEIITLAKDGTQSGSIGTNGAYVFIGSHGTSGKGIKITDALLPADNTGAFNDNDVNFGASNVRWKDAYFSGKINSGGTLSIREVIERAVILSGDTSGTINLNVGDEAVTFFSSNQAANRTINFRGDGSTTLNSILSTNESITVAVLMQQGSTAYYLNAYQIDGSSVTPKWSGGSAPTGGNASSIDAYSFTIIKTADATFTVLASITQYA